MTSDSDSDDSKDYEMLFNALYHEFPHCPFSISCIRDINELDAPFTTERTIFIFDGRASPDNYYYDGIPDSFLNLCRHFLKVESLNNNPITLRQVIQTMTDDEHYNNDIVRGDPHIFLEGFHQKMSDKHRFINPRLCRQLIALSFIVILVPRKN